MSEQINELRQQPEKSNGVTTWVLFLVLIFSVSYLYYQGFLLKNEFQDKLNDYKVSNSYLQEENNKQNQKINELQNSLSTVVNQIGQAEAKQSFSLFQLNQLINAATQSLIVYHDIKNTIRLLTYAKNLINNNSQAIYTDLKFAINKDIAKLEQIEEMDTIGLSGQLEQLNNQIDNLKSVSQKVTFPTKNELKDNQNRWQRFLSDIKNRLFSLVSISRIDKNNQIILMPDQEYIIKQNIKLNLLNAKMALMLHDDVAWKYTLKNAIGLLNGYFIPKSYNVNNDSISIVLEKLVKINVSDSGANIDDTLKALNKLNIM